MSLAHLQAENVRLRDEVARLKRSVELEVEVNRNWHREKAPEKNERPRRIRRRERERDLFTVYVWDRLTGKTQTIGILTKERGAYWLQIESHDEGDDADGWTIRVPVSPRMFGRLLKARETYEREKRVADAKARRDAREREAAERASEEAARKQDSEQAEGGQS